MEKSENIHESAVSVHITVEQSSWLQSMIQLPDVHV